MNKLFFFTLMAIISSIISLPATSFAAYKTVTIPFVLSGPTTDIQGLRMYYSYSADMADKILACETSNISTGEIICDVDISANTTYFFSVEVVTSEAEVCSNIRSISTNVPQIVLGLSVSLPTLSSGDASSTITDDFSSDTTAKTMLQLQPDPASKRRQTK